ncbi:MAG: hypothetical protein JNL70_26340 [Saprospiraceae bacterium]|nr:hypothetical protein [Saprospiraceae bacterium]
MINGNRSILSDDINGDDVITGSGSTLDITNMSDNCYNVIFILEAVLKPFLKKAAPKSRLAK